MNLPRILYFEDDDNDVELLKHQLAEDGLDVEIVRSATPREFLMALIAHPPAAVLTDGEVAGFTAISVVHAVRNHFFSVPVFCLTGLVTEEKARALRSAGISGMLSKSHLSRVSGELRKALLDRNGQDGVCRT